MCSASTLAVQHNHSSDRSKSMQWMEWKVRGAMSRLWKDEMCGRTVDVGADKMSGGSERVKVSVSLFRGRDCRLLHPFYLFHWLAKISPLRDIKLVLIKIGGVTSPVGGWRQLQSSSS